MEKDRNGERMLPNCGKEEFSRNSQRRYCGRFAAAQAESSARRCTFRNR